MKTKLTVIALIIYCTVFSQTKQDQRIWFAYIGQFKVSEKWGGHLEAQFRLDNQLEQNLQNLFRIGGVYFLSSRANITAGYALVNTYNVNQDDFFKENRLWEQYQLNTKWNDNKNMMTHRFRLEQRWVEQLSTDVAIAGTTNYQNRFRYLNRNLWPLMKLKSENNEVYAVFQNEVFLNLGDNKINSKFVDQNRLLVGFGLNCNNRIRMELGYMNHLLTFSKGDNLMNHTVSLSLLQNLDLQKQ